MDGLRDLRRMVQEGRVKETEFQSQVIELARTPGWRVAHFRTVRVLRGNGAVRYMTPVQADGAGFPDLFMVRRERAIAAELKRQTGSTTSEEQKEWLARLEETPVETYKRRPSDWDQIVTILR